MSGFSRDRNIKVPKKNGEKEVVSQSNYLPSRPAEGRVEVPKKVAKPPQSRQQNNQQRRRGNNRRNNGSRGNNQRQQNLVAQRHLMMKYGLELSKMIRKLTSLSPLVKVK